MVVEGEAVASGQGRSDGLGVDPGLAVDRQEVVLDVDESRGV